MKTDGGFLIQEQLIHARENPFSQAVCLFVTGRN